MQPTTPTSLEAARAEVDRLSLAILRLLSARGRCVLAIRRLKDERGLAVRDPRREAQLIDWLVSQNEGPFDEETVRTFFRAVIESSVTLMEREPSKHVACALSALR